MLVGVPLLVLVVGAMTYLLTGRALRPVEQIRARTSQISDADLGTRVDVPPTGDEVARLALTLNGMLDRLHALTGPGPVRRRREPRAAQPAGRRPGGARHRDPRARAADWPRPPASSVRRTTGCSSWSTTCWSSRGPRSRPGATRRSTWTTSSNGSASACARRRGRRRGRHEPVRVRGNATSSRAWCRTSRTTPCGTRGQVRLAVGARRSAASGRRRRRRDPGRRPRDRVRPLRAARRGPRTRPRAAPGSVWPSCAASCRSHGGSVGSGESDLGGARRSSCCLPSRLSRRRPRPGSPSPGPSRSTSARTVRRPCAAGS